MGIINQMGPALIMGAVQGTAWAVYNVDAYVSDRLENIRADKWLPNLAFAGVTSYYVGCFFKLGANDIITKAMENVSLPSHFVTGGLCYAVFQMTFEITRGLGGNYVALVSGIAATALFAHLISLPLIVGVGFALLGAVANFNQAHPSDDFPKILAALGTSVIYTSLGWAFALRVFRISNLTYDVALKANAFQWTSLAVGSLCAIGVNFGMEKLHFSQNIRDLNMTVIALVSCAFAVANSPVSLIHQIAMAVLTVRFAYFAMAPVAGPLGGGGGGGFIGGGGGGIETMSPVY